MIITRTPLRISLGGGGTDLPSYYQRYSGFVSRVPAGAVADLAELFHALSMEGTLAGHEVTQRFYEVGSPAGLRDFETYLATTSFSA